eukprot:gene22189-biopygen17701
MVLRGAPWCSGVLHGTPGCSMVLRGTASFVPFPGVRLLLRLHYAVFQTPQCHCGTGSKQLCARAPLAPPPSPSGVEALQKERRQRCRPRFGSSTTLHGSRAAGSGEPKVCGGYAH